MELTESTFSGTSDQVAEDEEIQSRQAEHPHQREEEQEPKSQETSQRPPERASNGSHAASAEQATAPTPDQPAPNERKASVIPHRNVIPARRTTFENTHGPAFFKRGAEASNVSGIASDPQPAISDTEEKQQTESVEKSEPPVSNPRESEQPTNALSAEQQVELEPADGLPTEYHDTSAAEAAWGATSQDDALSMQDTSILAATPQARTEQPQVQAYPAPEELERRAATAAIETHKMATPSTPLPPVTPLPATPAVLTDIPTTPLPAFVPIQPPVSPRQPLTRSRALLLLLLLAILLINASVNGFSQFFGPQGWGSVWSGSGSGGPNLLSQVSQQLQHSPTPGSKGTPTPPTPTQIVNLLMSNMTLDEKLGQMMMIQFAGQSYSPDLDTMISQYHVGSVLYFQFNIGSKTQLTGLNAQFQHNANLPMLIAVDQEGGTVDRLTDLDGPQPSASQIGASNDPNVAYQQGLKDARNLAAYGFNLNLAPVVDVNNVYNPQLYDRTFGNNPTIVSQMAEKYLEGLQQSGKVFGTLKHFPGLGDVSVDPHYGLPALTRSLSSLNSIDWAPYRNLIDQGHVYSIMVTHEIVDALDKTEPSSLSPQVIGVLRNQMHFQGVIITDSLTMDSIHNFYTYGEAAAKAVEAGDDILMGADSPSTLAQMITGIKQAMSSGAITQQQIDASVRRILLLKYELGLLHV